MRPRSSVKNLPLQTSTEDFNEYLLDESYFGSQNDYQMKDQTILKRKYLVAAIVTGVVAVVSLISMFFFL